MCVHVCTKGPVSQSISALPSTPTNPIQPCLSVGGSGVVCGKATEPIGAKVYALEPGKVVSAKLEKHAIGTTLPAPGAPYVL
jgi:hypothetical protein